MVHFCHKCGVMIARSGTDRDHGRELASQFANRGGPFCGPCAEDLGRGVYANAEDHPSRTAPNA